MSIYLKLRKTETAEETVRIDLPRINAPADRGLTSNEASERLINGYANTAIEPPTKTISQIVKSNLLTYFNLIFFVLAILVIVVGAYKELTFLFVIIINILVGIFQEIQAKKSLDKLNILATPQGAVIRDGQEITISTEEVVLDDIAVFTAGNQIYADAIVVDGEAMVNESLITGEADEIAKKPGDNLMSGSFVLSGKCYARLDKVGADSYASKLSIEAKKDEKSKKSEMMRSLDRLLKTIGIIIIPVGIALFYRQTHSLGYDVQQGVVATVAALIGMIPEGLYLLTTAALAVSVIRLAKRRVLVHEMRCIETLARVDVLCVDKTGTITENKMTVKDVVCLCEDRYIEDDIRLIMSDYVGNMGADNETMIALKKYFNGTVMQTAAKTLPFSSSKKYGGVSYFDDESYLLGAPEFILGDSYERYKDTIEKYSQMGCRVLLLALYDGDISSDVEYEEVMPLALILLTNKIRAEAPKTFKYFEEQGVAVKVISGDNPVTVSQVAIEAGIADAEHYVDAITLDTPEKIFEASSKYTVFGRVTPDQKRKLIRAMKADGHTVAMTGDGVNDVLALKDADCSIAMASGSDVAAHVSQLVLLESNFSAMPSVVAEGRRVINNIERSASLFLVKNIFSLFLALITISATLPYPVTPSQMSLVSGLCIGFPAFVLALEPNTNRIRGNFLSNVLYRAFPAGLTNVTLVLGAIGFYQVFGMSSEELSTISALLVGFVGITVVYRVCQPFNLLRKALFVTVVVGFVFSALFLKDLFSLTSLSAGGTLVLVVIILAAIPIIWAYEKILTILNEKTKPLRDFIAKWRQDKKKGKRVASQEYN